jgi:hypothetical protein
MSASRDSLDWLTVWNDSGFIKSSIGFTCPALMLWEVGSISATQMTIARFNIFMREPSILTNANKEKIA